MTLSHVSITGLSLCSMSISGLHDTFACSYHWSVTLFHVSMTLSISGPHHAVPVTESTTLSQSQNPPRCLSHRIHHAVLVTESNTLSQSQNSPRCPSHRIQHAAPCPSDSGGFCVIVLVLSLLLSPWSVCRGPLTVTQQNTNFNSVLLVDYPFFLFFFYLLISVPANDSYAD